MLLSFQYPSMAFVLKFILSNRSIVTPLSCHFHCMEYLFHPFTFDLCGSFALGWVSWRQHIVGCLFYSICHSFVGAFRPLTFKVIIDRHVFMSYCVDHNKLWKILKEMGIPDHLTCHLRNLYAGQEAMLELDKEQQTGSKQEKEYIKAVYCHPAYLTFMQSTS